MWWQLILVVTDDPRLFEARGLVFNDLEAYHRAEKVRGILGHGSSS
jgi:hypothetical protein